MTDSGPSDIQARRRRLALFVVEHYMPGGREIVAARTEADLAPFDDDSRIADLDRIIAEGAEVIFVGAVGGAQRLGGRGGQG